ncbi:hypothetical protein [Streptomyces sp. NPDC091212]|uniref:hypothetical protein n=1 Tax=Streptomyces sp. NPDC091212 TaxID=3155191 RepID=UPI003417625D
MTNRAAQALQEAVRAAAARAVTENSPAWMVASVTAVGADGTVDVTTARGPMAKVRRLKSYSAPAVSDVVVILTNPIGNWVVLGALAS